MSSASAIFGGAWLGRAMRASGAVFLAALLVSLGAASWSLSLGIAAGYALAVLLVISWSFIVRTVFTPEAARDPLSVKRRTLAIGLAVVKLPLIGAIVYLVIGRGMVSPGGFAGGFAIPQLTLGLLALGRLSATATGRAARTRNTVEGGLGA